MLLIIFPLRASKLKKSDLPPSQSITIKSAGGILELCDDDIKIVFPKGFISQQSITFNYRVLNHELFGSHSFPSNIRPVSIMLALDPQERVQFLKPIEITIPHYIGLENEDDCASLKFLTASSDIHTGQQKLDFKEVSEDMRFSLFTSRKKIQYATLYAHHCCHFCVGVIFREDTNKALFCLTQATSKDFTNGSFEVDLCIHYNLRTCMKVCVMCLQHKYTAGSPLPR